MAVLSLASRKLWQENETNPCKFVINTPSCASGSDYIILGIPIRLTTEKLLSWRWLAGQRQTKPWVITDTNNETHPQMRIQTSLTLYTVKPSFKQYFKPAKWRHLSYRQVWLPRHPIEGVDCNNTQLFRGRLSYKIKAQKHTRQCRRVLWVMLHVVYQCLVNKVLEYMYFWFLLPLFALKHHEIQSSNGELPLSVIPFGIVMYAFTCTFL